MTERRDELARNLSRVQERLHAACAAAGRSPADVRLVVVTKTFPVSDVVLLRELGVVDVGENRDQEAAPKAAAVPELRWHFIGRLQSNKARSVATYAHLVHSLDRPSLVAALGDAAARAERVVDVLIQVSLDGDTARGDTARGGAAIEAVPALAEEVAASPTLQLRGVMAVAPLGADAAASFARLADVADAVRAAHPAATEISAGMSGDLEEAVAAGATIVRVGSAVLGDRPRVLG